MARKALCTFADGSAILKAGLLKYPDSWSFPRVVFVDERSNETDACRQAGRQVVVVGRRGPMCAKVGFRGLVNTDCRLSPRR